MEDLEDTQDIFWGALPDVVPLYSAENYSNGKGNESVMGGGYKSNNYSYPPFHVYIPVYQVQNMNVDQLKENIMKIKTLCMVPKHS